MKMKYFGKFPIGNFIITNIIFSAIKYRLFYLRIKNTIRSAFTKEKPCEINLEITKINFQSYLNNGIVKINVGGGNRNLEGFLNIDFVKHPTVKKELLANILDLSFIPSNSLVHIHSNHLIEHLSDTELSNQLKEYYRILDQNGILTIRCPNILGVSYGFFFDTVKEENYLDFITNGYPKDDYFYNPKDDWYHKDFFGYLWFVYADRGNVKNQHLNILTPSKLRSKLITSGFQIKLMTEPETTNLIVIATKAILNPN